MKVNEDGTEQVKVTWPKFLNGEAVVKNVRVAQNFCKVLSLQIPIFIPKNTCVVQCATEPPTIKAF